MGRPTQVRGPFSPSPHPRLAAEAPTLRTGAFFFETSRMPEECLQLLLKVGEGIKIVEEDGEHALDDDASLPRSTDRHCTMVVLRWRQ
jgi:hypothetical protein